MELSVKTVHGPVLKIYTALCACGDHDFSLTASNFGNLTVFRAICSHIFTAHAQKRLFMNFRLKFWHHHSIP